MKFFTYKKIIVAVVIIIGISIVVPTQVSAQDTSSGVYSLPAAMIYYTLAYINYVVSNILQAVANMFNNVLRLPTYYDLPVVEASWNIVRDVANILFIIAIIVMAFGTILDLDFVQGYDWRAMLVRFIFIALIVNFSLAISGLIIYGTQIVSNVFLNSIGDASALIGQLTPIGRVNTDPGAPATAASASASNWSLSGSARVLARLNSCIAQSGGAGPISSAVCFGQTAGQAAVGAALPQSAEVRSSSVQLMVNIILQTFMIFSLGIGLIFALVRIPILWMLMIVSPLAWIAGIFPAWRSYSHRWWNAFWGWNFFLPIYLMFLYFGFYFLSRQGEIMAAIQSRTGLAPQSFLGGLGITVQEFFLYFLSYFILITAANTAFKVGNRGGAEATALYVKGKSAAFGKWLSYRGGYREAAEQRWKQFKQEGFRDPGLRRFTQYFGGTGREGYEKRVAAAARGFGVRDADKKYYQFDVNRYGREYKEMQDQFNVGQMTKQDLLDKAISIPPTEPEGLAARKLLAEKGWLSDVEYENVFDALGNNPYAINDFSDTAKKSKFGSMPTDKLKQIALAKEGTPYAKYRQRVYTPLRQDAFSIITENRKEVVSFTPADFNSAIELSGGPGTEIGKKLLENVKNIHPTLWVEYIADTPALNREGLTKEQLMRKALNVKPKIVAAMTKETWSSPMFAASLREKIADKNVDLRTRIDWISEVAEELKDNPDSEIKINLLVKARKGTDLDPIAVQEFLKGNARELGNRRRSRKTRDDEPIKDDKKEEKKEEEKKTENKDQVSDESTERSKDEENKT